jgi:hypothetical protein
MKHAERAMEEFLATTHYDETGDWRKTPETAADPDDMEKVNLSSLLKAGFRPDQARDEKGQWTSEGAVYQEGGVTPSEAPSKMGPLGKMMEVREHARKLGFDSSKISFVPEHRMTLAAVVGEYVAAEYYPAKGTIGFNERFIREHSVARICKTLEHEVSHHFFEKALRNNEQAVSSFLVNNAIKLRDEDGVTRYSRYFWQTLSGPLRYRDSNSVLLDGPHSFTRAVNESLAELSKIPVEKYPPTYKALKELVTASAKRPKSLTVSVADFPRKKNPAKPDPGRRADGSIRRRRALV